MKQLRKQEIKKLSKEFRRNKEISVVLENIEYARNVASMFRTADAAGVRRLYLTGVTPTPPFGKELRQASRSKEKSISWTHKDSTLEAINSLKAQGYIIIAVELADEFILLSDLKEVIKDHEKVAFVFGSEMFGIKKETLEQCYKSVLVPMYGKGASLNVATTMGIVLYSF